uniref:Uncharacterized protein n=1 Tax=Pipistrellus kuhlii TaxID=59472 RepID=A0A7J7YAC7_PIPKU|nr:hypothetical protein mPipKuh1_010268 [Pipistrellus kuhlii]
MHTFTHIDIYTHIYISTRTHTYTHTHQHTFTQIYITTHAYAHTHKHVFPFPLCPTPTKGIHLALWWQLQHFEPSGKTGREGLCQGEGEDSQVRGGAERKQGSCQIPIQKVRSASSNLPPKGHTQHPHVHLGSSPQLQPASCVCSCTLLPASATSTHSGDI